MNDYIKLYNERRKKKLKEIELAKKKFDSLSLVEKNAYYQIIERQESSGLLFYLPFKMLFYVGVFFIVFSIMSGVPLETFRLSFLALVRLVGIATLLFLMIDFLSMAFNSYHINKLKLKLLI